MDASKIDIEKLDKLRIHELRDVARQLGVKSPTSLTKGRIIEEVRLIVSGDKDPYYNTHRQGRPTKAETIDFADFTAATTPLVDALTKPWQVETVTPSYVLKCNEFEFTKSLPTDRMVMGYVDIHPDGYGLVRKSGFMPSNMDTFIPSALVIKYNLVSGMYITGVERFVANGKPYALIAIESREVPDGDYNKLSGGPLGKKIYSYLNIDVLSGGRYFIQNENSKDLFVNAYAIAQSVAKTNSDVLTKVIFTKSLPERLPADNGNVEVLDIPFDTEDRNLINCVNLFLAKAKLDALNKHVVIVLTGLSEIAKAYNNVLNGENGTKINPSTSNKVNAILASAKSIKGSSCGITLICVDNMHVSDELKQMFEYDVMDNFSN